MPEGQGLALSADNREAADSAVGACRQRVRSSKRACSVMLLEPGTAGSAPSACPSKLPGCRSRSARPQAAAAGQRSSSVAHTFFAFSRCWDAGTDLLGI
jgi:hypothetical protein